MKKYADKKCHQLRVAFRTSSSFRYRTIKKLVPHLSRILLKKQQIHKINLLSLKGAGLAKKGIKDYNKTK